MRVFFLTLPWTAFKRFVEGQTSFPEGTPSVYLPWLRYIKRGHSVDVFITWNGAVSKVMDFYGCRLHIIPRPRLFRRTRWHFPMNRLVLLVDSILVYLSVMKTARDDGKPDVIYSYGC